jgi:hypothetical protein
LSVFAQIEGDCGGLIVKFVLFDPEQNILATKSTDVSGKAPFSVQFRVEDASFWWPVGLGKHPLYTVRAELIHNVSICPA